MMKVGQRVLVRIQGRWVKGVLASSIDAGKLGTCIELADGSEVWVKDSSTIKPGERARKPSDPVKKAPKPEVRERSKPQMTPRQRLFVAAYLGAANFSPSKAAKLAGYKGEGRILDNVSAKVLKHPLVKAKVEKEIQRRSKVLSMQGVAYELSRAAKGNWESIKPNERLKALELLARIHGAFDKKIAHEHSGPGGTPMQIQTFTIHVPIKKVEEVNVGEVKKLSKGEDNGTREEPGSSEG